MTAPRDCLLRGSEATPFGLYHLQQATAVQLTRLHYAAGSITYVKDQLKELTRAGYIQADAQRTKHGDGGYYYTLATKGAQYLKELGYPMGKAWRSAFGVDKSQTFLDHAFEINDVVISAALLPQFTHLRVTLHRYVQESVFRANPYVVEWRERMSAQAAPKNRTRKVIPDGYLDLRTPQGQLPVLLEVDRGMETETVIRQKIRAYVAFLKSEGYKTWLKTGSVTICFVTFTSKEHLAELVAWAQAELASTKEPAAVAQAFRFAYFPKEADPTVWTQAHWYLPYPYQGQREPAALLAETSRMTR